MDPITLSKIASAQKALEDRIAESERKVITLSDNFSLIMPKLYESEFSKTLSATATNPIESEHPPKLQDAEFPLKLLSISGVGMLGDIIMSVRVYDDISTDTKNGNDQSYYLYNGGESNPDAEKEYGALFVNIIIDGVDNKFCIIARMTQRCFFENDIQYRYFNGVARAQLVTSSLTPASLEKKYSYSGVYDAGSSLFHSKSENNNAGPDTVTWSAGNSRLDIRDFMFKTSFEIRAGFYYYTPSWSYGGVSPCAYSIIPSVYVTKGADD
jgi:hypothetical protein